MPISCPHCNRTVLSDRGLRQHINGTPVCLELDRSLAGVSLKPPPLARMPHAYPGYSYTNGKEDQPLRPKVKRFPSSFAHDDENQGNGSKKFRPNGQDSQEKLQALSRLLGKQTDLLDKHTRLASKFAASEVLARGEESESEATGHVWPGDDDVSDDDDERGGELVFVEEQPVFYGPIDMPEARYPFQPFVWDGVDPVPRMPQDIGQYAYRPDWQNDPNNDVNINISPNTKMRHDFKEFCARARSTYQPTFTNAQARAIRLLDILKRKRAPLDTYDEVIEWHHREKGDISERESLQHVGNVDEYISRYKMIECLKDRYNMRGKFPKKETLNLPNSKAQVTLTVHQAWHCIESLLTDPRVNDEDYNFLDGDPFAKPPETISVVGDLHTGLAYKQAYEKFITKPRQVLLPIIMYIDGAVTGQFSNLPITALKIALGIHTRKYRDKSHAWRSLGFVGQVSKAKSRGKRLFRDSGHVDAQNYDLDDEEGMDDATNDACKAQDYHTMLDMILVSFLDVQTNGFMWDLRYRGKTYKDVEFVPFVMFIKCDTDEADVLCGSYKSRSAGVAQLCRYCTCPTLESDLVNATFPVKSVAMIASLVEAENFDGLKQLSQQMIQNAWYKIRFHPNIGQGIHGACPSEMLHALLLGIFKYTRDCFFDQIGPTSGLAKEINALAQQYGEAFGRQSERDMPKCKFGEGIQKGKLMANEFRGILLVIASVLRSDKGKCLLRKNKNFASDFQIDNWGTLVEMLLEWEAFLNEPEMTYAHVFKLRKKNRYMMYLIKRIARRSEGMGWKLMKFHVIIHMWLDILLYGVPKEVDTGSNESGHKETKVAARLTQKNVATFDFQTCTRLDEFMLIDLAMHELTFGQSTSQYYVREADPLPPDPPPFKSPNTSGAHINVFKSQGKTVYSIGQGKAAKIPANKKWDEELLWFLEELQTKLGTSKLQIRCTHDREGVKFRGSPDFLQKPWRDWAMIDWGGPNSTLPGQIWCFVIIDTMKDDDEDVRHGGINVENGHYAVVECADYAQERREKQMSDIFVPIKKEVAQRATADGDQPWRRKFWLADVEAIAKPLVVVPNIGGKQGVEYFIVKQREEWVQEFKAWLDRPVAHDIIGNEEPVPSCFLPQN
jgi:hypothetical protein